MDSAEQVLSEIVNDREGVESFHEATGTVMRWVRQRQRQLINDDIETVEGGVAFSKEVEQEGLEGLAHLMAAARFAVQSGRNLDGDDSWDERADDLSRAIYELIRLIGLYRANRLAVEREMERVLGND